MQLHVGRRLLDYVPLQMKIWNTCYANPVDEAEKWDLAPKTASLWWTSTYQEEERSEMLIATHGLLYAFHSEEKFGKSLDAIEERMRPQGLLEGHLGLQE